jgi:hypothetical protein
MTSRCWSLAAVSFGALLSVAPAAAHHSFAAQYDASKRVTLTGPVTKVEWMNPHIYFYADVKDGGGDELRVRDGRAELSDPDGMDTQFTEGRRRRNRRRFASARRQPARERELGRHDEHRQTHVCGIERRDHAVRRGGVSLRARIERWGALAPAIAMLAAAALPARAQWWQNVPDKTPRTASGEPNLAAPAPRTADGRPDLSGIWSPNGNKYLRNLAADLDDGDVPYQPWAKALADERADGSHSREDPDANCLPQGVPKIAAAPAPWKIVQTPSLIVVVHEAFSLWRQIFLDGRRLADDVQPTWMGYSTGRWDGDSLVVDTRGFNGKAWLDQLGKPSTEQLRVTERYRRTDFGHLELTVTIDDPGAYTRPWTVTQQATLLPDTELLEFICNENNKDLQHLPGAAAD